MEKELQAKVIKYINSLPQCKAYAIIVSPGMERGMPDILACIKGRFTGIETKSPGDKPSEIQKEQLIQIKEAIGHGVWFDNFREAKEFIDVYYVSHI